jgi:hypothetical protein
MKKNEGVQIKKVFGSIGTTIKNKSILLRQKLSKIIKKNDNNNKLNNTTIGHEKRKSFNIQISEEENVYDVNDDEEEEEYEEINESNIINEEKKIINEKEDNISINKNNIQNNINEDIQGISLSQKIQDFSDDIICHYIFLKGTLISKDIIPVIEFTKIKPVKRKSILNRFVFGKKQVNNKDNNNQDNKIPYLAFFDEQFLYFLKDKEINELEKNTRIIGNKYNICKLIEKKIERIENEKKLKVNLVFLIENKKILKQMLFDKDKGNEFINILNNKIGKFNIKLNNN